MPLMHVVCIKFKPEVTVDAAEAHLQNDLRLKERMPDLVRHWTVKRNASLVERSDCNLGMEWVISVEFANKEALAAYQVHPQHMEVVGIQKPLIAGKFVCDYETEELASVPSASQRSSFEARATEADNAISKLASRLETLEARLKAGASLSGNGNIGAAKFDAMKQAKSKAEKKCAELQYRVDILLNSLDKAENEGKALKKQLSTQ